MLTATLKYITLIIKSPMVYVDTVGLPGPRFDIKQTIFPSVGIFIIKKLLL